MKIIVAVEQVPVRDSLMHIESDDLVRLDTFGVGGAAPIFEVADYVDRPRFVKQKGM